MKPISSILLLLGATILSVSCNEAEKQNPGPSKLLSLSANIEQPDATSEASTQQLSQLFGSQEGISTHTIIDAETNPHSIVWSPTDIISVHFDTDPKGVMRIYSLEGEGNSATGNFVYNYAISSNPDIPYDQIPDLPDSYNSLLAGYSGLYTTITPAGQDVILQTPIEIFLGLESVEDFPMIGSAQAGQPISFHCPFGLIHIPVTGNIALERIYFDTTEQQQEIAGYFVIDPITYEPDFHHEATQQNQFTTKWATTEANGTQLSDTPLDFYVVLPPGIYEAGTILRFQTPDGTTFEKKTLKPFTVKRAEILNLPTLHVEQIPEPHQ